MFQSCCGCGHVVRIGGICPNCGNSCRSSSLSAAAVLLGLSLAGCSGSKESEGSQPAQALYGTSMVDADGDGYPSADAGGDDCDDSNMDIHPDATETPGDGVDSNCDGSDDT